MGKITLARQFLWRLHRAKHTESLDKIEQEMRGAAIYYSDDRRAQLETWTFEDGSILSWDDRTYSTYTPKEEEN